MRDVDAATWDRLLAESPGGGHIRQTYAWGEFKATEGWKPLRLALKQGNNVLGVGQVLIRHAPGAPGAVAYCPKGPWIDWSDAAAVRAMLQGMEHFARRRGAYILKVESELPSGPGQPSEALPSVEAPLSQIIATARRLRGAGTHDGHDGAPEDDKRVAEARAGIAAVREEQARDGNAAGRVVFGELDFVKSRWDMQFRTTWVVDLDRPPDAMLARMKSKTRYNVNLARRKGVTVVQDDSPKGRETLYDMYVHTSQRDGFILRARDYFARAWDTMIEAGHAHIFFACHEGRPLAAIMAEAFGNKVWYQVGASYTDGRNLMPAPLLQFHVMQWAWERGKTYYDFVAIPNLENMGKDSMWGLYTFKSGFGGRPIEWAGCMDKILDPRGYAWEALEPAYYRLYKWRRHDVFY